MQTTSTGTLQPQRWRTVVIDDHPVVRAGLQAMVEQMAQLEFAGSADDAEPAMALIAASSPHLALLDLTLKSGSAMPLLKRIHATWPALRVLVLSMHDELAFAEPAIRAGARGYVMKSQEDEAIARAIERVIAGEIVVSPAVNASLLARLGDGRDTARGGARGDGPGERPAALALHLLSEREMQIFSLLGAGRSGREIARGLGISMKTLDTHRERICRKLQLRGAHELLVSAIRHSLD